MNNNHSTGYVSGVTFSGLLTIAFIILKLCGVIAWPWIWVLSPLWISIGLVLVFILILGIIALIFNKKG